jgi:hypothetical protein
MKEGKGSSPGPPEPIEPGGSVGMSSQAPEGPAILAPNRADLIFGLGLLSLCCCWPVGIFAWIMGSYDLRKIRTGRMSSEKSALLKIGWLLGILSTLFLVISLAAGFYYADRLPRTLSDFGKNLQWDLKRDLDDLTKGKPLPSDQMIYVGEWVGENGTLIKIYPNGHGDFVSVRDSARSSTKGGLVRIEEKTLSIGMFGIYKKFHIDHAPHRERGKWIMTLDGELFVRKRLKGEIISRIPMPSPHQAAAPGPA